MQCSNHAKSQNSNNHSPTAENTQSRLVKSAPNKKYLPGFTLIEMLLTISILGILSSIALPNYLSQVNRTRQNEAASTISQIQTTIASYADEFGLLPTSWAELNETSAVMTDEGPATKESFEAITLAGGHYQAVISNTDNIFTITATRSNTPNLNIIACVNLSNGASAINQGTHAAAASPPNCGQ